MMEVLGFVWGGVLLLLYVIVLRVLIVRFFGLRLTDWLGYIFCVAALVAGPTRLWDITPWLLWGLPIAAAIAVVQAQRTIRTWRRGETVGGIFTFGRAPEGVVDRFRIAAT